jgi:hypothetical protein
MSFFARWRFLEGEFDRKRDEGESGDGAERRGTRGGQREEQRASERQVEDRRRMERRELERAEWRGECGRTDRLEEGDVWRRGE